MRSRAKSLRALASLLILGGLVVWVAWYVGAHAEQFAVVKQVRPASLLLLYAAFAAVLVCNGKLVEIVASAFDVRFRAAESLALSTATSFANYFLPLAGGVGLRGLYLWKMHRLPVADFVPTLGAMYLMRMAVNGVLAMVGMAMVVSAGGHANVSLLVFMGVISAVAVVLMTCDPRLARWSRLPLGGVLERTLEGWSRLRRRTSLLAKLALMTAVFTLLGAWQCKIAFDAISVPISWGGVLVYAACRNVAAVVSLTPGSLGIVEGVSIYLGTVLGYTTAQALLVQGLLRSVALSTLVIAGPLAFLLLRRRIARLERETLPAGEVAR